MAHAAKRAKLPSPAKSSRSAPVSSLKRSLASKSVKHPLTRSHAGTSGASGTPGTRSTVTVTKANTDTRGKSHGGRSYATATETAKRPAGDKPRKVVRKASTKRAEVTRYGESAKAKRSGSGVPRAAHKAKAAHLPHNGTAHHEQYKK